jgi:2-polyprenyl-6-methoxyphenol hydroxylase-like FAD-dependent oxidoreductase
MRIAIIGAGIGGLAVAAALHQRGFAAEVYEQADKFARVGAGLQQSPNAVKVHRGLGIEDRVRQVANRPASSLNRDGITGAVTISATSSPTSRRADRASNSASRTAARSRPIW